MKHPDSRIKVIELQPRYVNTQTAERLYGVSGDTLIAAVKAGKLLVMVDPVLKAGTPIYEYEPDTWGPAEADTRLKPAGGWHNPAPKETAAISCLPAA